MDLFDRLPVMKFGAIGSMIGLLIVSWGLYYHFWNFMVYVAVCNELNVGGKFSYYSVFPGYQ